MPRLTFRLRMATHYTGFMTVMGLVALLAKAPQPALWMIAALWLWFAKAFWVYREDMGFGPKFRRNPWVEPPDLTPEEMQARLRRIWG